jgi:PAS domain S-box-containing protein
MTTKHHQGQQDEETEERPRGSGALGSSEPIDVLCVGFGGGGRPSLADRLARTDTEPALPVHTAASAGEALGAITDDARTIACVVSAYDLDGSSGLELLEAVRRLDDDLPFVLVAADGSETVASRAISAGVTDYVPLDGPGTGEGGTVAGDGPLVADGTVDDLAERVADAAVEYRVARDADRAYLALETVREAIGILDDDGTFTYVNRAYADYYGYDREEMVGMHWGELYPEGGVDHVVEEILPRVRREGSWTGRTTGRRADGSTFPELHSLTDTGDGGLVCAVRDGSERQRHREQLQRYREYTDDILDAIDDVFYVVADSGQFKRWNESLVEASGYSDEEIATMDPFEFVADADQLALAEGIKRVFETGSARVGAAIETKDGEEIPYEFVAAALEDPDGTPVLAGIGRDVSEQQERQAELQLFRCLIDRSNDSVFVIDPATGRFLDANATACTRLGYETEELLDRRVFDVEATFEAESDWEEHVATVRAEGATTKEGVHRRADGSTFPVEINVVHVELDREYMFAIARDVTERRERERSLRQLSEITSRTELPFDEKARELLELGRERFGLDVGFVASVDGGRVSILQAVGDHELIRPGATDDLDVTYCRRVFGEPGSLAVAEAPREGWTDDPAYERYGLDAYLGTGISAGREPFGTLCFADRSPREEPFTDAETTYLELLGQWLSYELERERREERLAALNGMSRELMAAEDRAAIASTAVDHADGDLGLPVSAILTYDRERGELAPAAQTSRAEDELPNNALCEAGSGPLWEAFVTGENRLVKDVAAIPGAGDLSAAVAVPLGDQGLFVTATRRPEGFADAEMDVVEATAATVEAAITRADRERLLQERERTLEEQNESLGRLDRVNDIIRNIDHALVESSTRSEIETVVCEQLADAGPYELAWIGEHDAVAREVRPIEWAGSDPGYLDDFAITTDEPPEGRGPTGRAVTTREPQYVDDILREEPFEPWRQAALDRGYHATIALPLVYQDTFYGVLTVYAGPPGVFDELERTVLSELADTIAYAINAVESRKALVTDEVTELEFEMDAESFALAEVSESVDPEITLENLIPGPDGELTGFFTSRGVTGEVAREAAAGLAVTDLELVSEREDDGEPVCLFEAELTDACITAAVLDHGGRPHALRVADGSATVTAHLAATADVGEFVEMIETRHPGATLVANHSREQPRRTLPEARSALTEALTARQLETLQTAYFSGYFEQPRSRTASEIADSMGIAQPTFNAHLRTAHRKLAHQLFEADSLDG